MPDFGYDVKLAVTIDGVKKDEMPSSPEGKDGKYYEVKVNCGSSKTSGLWDYNAWRLNLDYIESNSKCNLTFTSSMSKEEYDKYIQAGVALRRNTYRGKDITDLWRSEELYKQIEDGTFADIYVGDYIQGSSGVIWLIADLDNYLNSGITPLEKHHATVIPARSLEKAKMNEEKSTVNGYAGSEMITTLNNTILQKYITPDFGNHIISYYNLLSNKMSADGSNQWGLNDGVSSGWSWNERKLDLMSEVNVFGSTIMSSSFFDVGIDNRQYAIFQLRPELINQDLEGNTFEYWLKAVSNSENFVFVDYVGTEDYSLANILHGVRPRFLID